MSEDLFHLGVKALIKNSGGKVLLLRVCPSKLHGESKDYWDLPGGRVQYGETMEATLRREIQEEIGITSILNAYPLTMVLSNIRIPVEHNNSVGLILSIYTCTVPENIKIHISEEHISFEWQPPEKATLSLGYKYPAEFCKAIANIK